MRRREFMAVLGGGAALPLVAIAQQPHAPIVGILGIASAQDSAALVDAVRQGLKELGYAEGNNLSIEQRWAEGDYARLPALASELVSERVSIIVAAGGTSAALAAKAATETIPIIFQVAADPVAAGLVASLNHPGGNLTGVSNLAAQLGPKRLELLHQVIPAESHLALLVNPTNAAVAERATKGLEAAARDIGVQLETFQARSEHDLAPAFARLVQAKAGGLIVVPDLVFVAHIRQLGALTVQNAVPAIFMFREFAAAGGLMSYGGDIEEAYRQVGKLTGRILKGEKPADLPVMQLTSVELTINLKTANALGITIPPTLLARADEVIE